MRIFNGTHSHLSLPFSGNQRLSIPAYSASGDIMGTKELVQLLVVSFNTDEIAIIVSGPYELSLCANASNVAVNYVVQSLDEALQRFMIEKPKEEEVKVEPEPEPEPKTAEPEEEKVEEAQAEEEEKPVVKVRRRAKHDD